MKNFTIIVSPHSGNIRQYVINSYFLSILVVVMVSLPILAITVNVYDFIQNLNEDSRSPNNIEYIKTLKKELDNQKKNSGILSDNINSIYNEFGIEKIDEKQKSEIPSEYKVVNKNLIKNSHYFIFSQQEIIKNLNVHHRNLNIVGNSIQSNLFHDLPLGRPLRYGVKYDTSSYSYRIHPILGRIQFHSGVDTGAEKYTPVYSTARGYVYKTSWNRRSGYGNTIIIQHENGFQTVYAHLSRILVRKGSLVDRYTKIGLVGSTGASTGYHLHYEIRLMFNKYSVDHIDPIPFMCGSDFYSKTCRIYNKNYN